MKRLRIGIVLIILSWLPFAQVLIQIAHDHSKLGSSHATDVFRLSIWGIQFLIGFVGLWLVGKLALQEVKEAGWKHTPKRLWRLFWSNQDHDSLLAESKNSHK